MLIALGQVRPSRTSSTNPEDFVWQEAATDYLPAAKSIASRIAGYYEGPYEYGRIQSIKLADRAIRPDQRFYDVEYRQAATILQERSPNTETASNWYALMYQNAGYRIVSTPFCSYGQEPDPVTRKCVEKRVPAPVRKPVIPGLQPTPETEPQPTPESEAQKGMVFDTDLILPVGIAAIALVVLLGGRK